MYRLCKSFAVITFLICVLTSLIPQAVAQTVDEFAEMLAPPEVGDDAPPLPISRWIGGEEGDPARHAGPYVVVFNITACPSCRKALPLLSELSDVYGDDVPIINIFAHELPVPGDAEDLTSLEKVGSLLTALGDRVSIPVAVDGPERQISKLWGIYVFPSAYLVQDGKITWTGDPTWLEPVLEQVSAGTFDPAEAHQEQEAYESRRLAAHTASASGEYDTALNIADELLAAHPDESSLYFFKYQLLLEADRQHEADQLVEYLIAADPKGFDWDHFVPLTYLYPEEPDFDLALRAADKAIQNAEWDFAAASLMAWKAKIHLARFDSNAEHGNRDDIEAGLSLLQRAMEAADVSGDIRDRRRFEAEFLLFKFRSLAGRDDEGANQALSSLLSQEAPRMDWRGLVSDALRYQDEPDIRLLLWAADRAFIQAFDEAAKAEALAAKASVYAYADNLIDAAEFYQAASETAGFAGMDEKSDAYEAAMSALENDQ